MTEVFYALTWAAQILYFIGLLPQIAKNHKRKSTEGLSDLFLIGYWHGYAAGLFYIFGMDLPPAYQLMLPLGTIATLVIISQRIFYAPKSKQRFLFWLYISNILVYIPFMPSIIANPLKLGMVWGWINLGINCINMLPQVHQIYKTNSTRGFSYMFAAILFLGALCESSAAYLLNLPVQSFLNGTKNIFFFVLFSIQFLIYKK